MARAGVAMAAFAALGAGGGLALAAAPPAGAAQTASTQTDQGVSLPSVDVGGIVAEVLSPVETVIQNVGSLSPELTQIVCVIQGTLSGAGIQDCA